MEVHSVARVAVDIEPLWWSEQVANVTSKLVRYRRDKMGCQFANLSDEKYIFNNDKVGPE